MSPIVQGQLNCVNIFLQVEIVETLCKVHKVPAHQIAILTPYSAQKIVIDKMMKEMKLAIKVASITESQGNYYSYTFLDVTV